LPAASIAAQKLALGQETSTSSCPGSMDAAVQVAASPSGSEDVRRWPASSTAAQKLVLGQEMEVRSPADASSAATSFQAAAPPVGSVEIRTVPLPPAAAQKSSPAQSMPLPRLNSEDEPESS
jgi:hypothetical protein